MLLQVGQRRRSVISIAVWPQPLCTPSALASLGYTSVRPLSPLPQVPYYEYALDMILDNEPPADVMLTDQQHEMLENAAEMLYGLIHARYVVTARGLTAMLEKFKSCDFGRCPRWVEARG